MPDGFDIRQLELDVERAKQRLEDARRAVETAREVAKAVADEQTRKAARIEAARAALCGNKVVEKAQSDGTSDLPMYERLYCAPASMLEHSTNHYIGNLGSKFDAGDRVDAPIEPIHESNCQHERSMSDIGMAVWVETGRHLSSDLRWQTRLGGDRALYWSISLDPRPLLSEDVVGGLRELEDDAYTYNPAQPWATVHDTRVNAARVNLDARDNDVGILLPRVRSLSENPVHLALEFGFDVCHDRGAGWLSSDDPRELTCDSRGHVEAYDRWTRAEW